MFNTDITVKECDARPANRSHGQRCFIEVLQLGSQKYPGTVALIIIFITDAAAYTFEAIHSHNERCLQQQVATIINFIETTAI